MALSKRAVETITAEGNRHRVVINREGTEVLSVTIYEDSEYIDLDPNYIGEFMECCEFIKQQLEL